MITHGGLDAYGRSATKVGLFGPGDRVLVQVPLATTAGSIIQTVPSLRAGATLVLMDVFEASASLELIEAERVTCYVAPPTIYVLQLNVPNFAEYDLSSLRHLIAGAAPVPAELATRIVQCMKAKLTNSYGATESGGLVTYMPEGASEEKVVESCGVAAPGYDIRIVDEDRAVVPLGEVGEIAVRGGSIMKGYYRAEEQTQDVLDDEGWWYSGDLGTIDDEGYLRVVGRIKDMYIRGGFNVYPAEVESALHQQEACRMSPFMAGIRAIDIHVHPADAQAQEDLFGPDAVGACVREFPDIFLGFASVDPWKGRAAVQELERAIAELGLCGLKLHPVAQGFSRTRSGSILSGRSALSWGFPFCFIPANRHGVPELLVAAARS